MADTYTTNLNLTKPEVGSSTDTWGTKLNTDLDTLDGIFSATGTEINVRFNSANFDDNKRAIFGNGDDMHIYHSGTDSIIQDVGQGNLKLLASNLSINNSGDTQSYLTANDGGDLILYKAGSEKARTSTDGFNVTGRGTFTASDFQIKASNGTDEPWFLRAKAGGNLALHKNGTGDVVEITASGIPYSSLTGTPTIPTNNNQLTNGAGYVTTNTTYSAGTGLALSGTTFSVNLASGNALSSGNWIRSTDGENRFYFTHSGTTYFGSGSEYVFRNASDVDRFIIDSAGSGFFDGNVTAYYSDERLKDKQGKIENALDKVSKIETFYFKENELAKSLGHDNDKMQVGVSAQSVKAVLPEIIDLAPFDIDAETKESKSGEDYMTVDYAKLTPLLIEAIKELKDELKELRGV